MTGMMIAIVTATMTMMMIGDGGIDAVGRAFPGAIITAAMSATSTAIGSVVGKQEQQNMGAK